tara:strand:- start:46 stop:372 length:327 start_codon:yes stop_codon:yes gene_type:complete
MSLKKEFKILIYPGLHSRPGGKFVQFCKDYESAITLRVGETSVDGRSLLGLFKLEPKQFTEIEVEIEGPDENKFMDNLINWETEAYFSKEEFDNDNLEEHLMTVFEEL